MTCDVLVLGSKPKALVPPADHVYAANASGFFYRQRISENAVVNVVASAGEIYTNACAPTKKLENIVATKPNKIFVTGSNKRAECIRHLYSNLLGVDIEVLPSSARRKLINKLFWLPFLPSPFFLLKPLDQRSLKLNYMYLKAIVNQMVRDENVDVPVIFRPSTGAFSLVLALRDLPRAERYIISGVGLSERSAYPAGICPSGMLKNDAHIIADQILFSRLAKRYPLFTTDLELASKTGIPIL